MGCLDVYRPARDGGACAWHVSGTGVPRWAWGAGRVRQEEAATCAPHEEKRSRHAGPSGARARGHSPLALAGVQGELLAAPGADRQLVLGAVEDIQEQVALPGTAWGRQRRVQSLATAREESDFAFASSPKISHCWKVSET